MRQSGIERPRSFALNAIAAGVALSFGTLAPISVVVAQEEGDQATELGTQVITGSRLKRSDIEGALPVTVVSRAQIEASGLPSVADVVRSLSFNSFGSFRDTSGTSFAGQAQVSLRGLGADRTLVLINGRRQPPSPVAGASAADLNTIPLEAVERIEVLTDGASAIYGSDAIGGVINVILRKDYSGSTAEYLIGRPTREGGDEDAASFLSGLSTADSNLLFGISYQRRDAVALRDRDYSSFFPGDGVNASTTRGANLVGNTLYGFSSYQYYAGPNCAPDRVYNYDVAGPGNTACLFAFADIAYDTQDVERRSVFSTGSHKINTDLSVYYQATYSRVEAFGRFAPVADAVVLPANAAANPLGEPALLFHRYQQLGPRDNQARNQVLDFVIGANGALFDMPFEFGIRQSRYDGVNIGKNYTIRSIARQFLTDGTYNPYDLSQNSQQTLNLMKINTARESTYKYQEAFGNITVPLFAMPAGQVELVVGGEARDDEYADLYDPTSAAGNVGGTAGNSATGGRSAHAAFVETLIPVLDNLEVGAAYRYDKYSDFGTATTGKLSVRYQPFDALTFRGSIGEGFRAPILSDLYGALSQTAPTVRDFTQCRAAGISDADCPARQVTTGNNLGGYVGSNPELEAEESDQYSIGFAAQPIDVLNFTLDYYKIKLDNAVQNVSFQELVRREADGQGLPPGTSITRQQTNDGSVGRILRIQTGPANVASIETDGLDLNVNFNMGLPFGRVSSSLQASYVLEYVDSENKPGQDQVGDPGIPQWRGIWRNGFGFGDFAFNYYINYIDSTSSRTVPVGDGTERQEGHVSSFLTHDFQVVWSTPFKSELTVGVRNAFDRGPSTNFDLDNPYYDNTLYDPYGRVPYIGFKQNF